MTFVKTDILNPYNRQVVSNDYFHTLIKFLLEYYPSGFERPTDIYVNAVLIDVDDYDMTLSEDAVVVIMERPALPAAWFANTFIAWLANTALSMALSYAINKIFAPDMKTVEGQNNEASTVYNLNASQNEAKAGQVIPVIYGTVRQYPSMVSPPYYRYDNNEQYLYHLLCIGQGRYNLDKLLISEQDVTIDADVDYAMLTQDKFYNIPLFTGDPDYVQTVSTLATPSQYELRSQNNSLYRIFFATSNTIQAINQEGETLIEVGDKLVFNDVVPANRKVFTIIDKVWDAGGYFVLTTAETVTTEVSGKDRNFGWVEETDRYDLKKGIDYIEVDYVYPSGLYEVDSNGRFIDLIDSFEMYIYNKGTGQILETVYIETTNADNSPIRETLKKDVKIYSGIQLQVSFMKTTASSGGSGAVNTLYIERVKELLPPTDSTDYGDITLLWVKIKATNAISGAGQTRVNGFFTRTDVANDMNSVLTDIYSNSTYGGKLPESELDFPVTSQTVNGAFDKSMTIWDSMTQVAKSQKYTVYPIGQDILLKYDDIKNVTTALFNETNIIRDSFEVTYYFKEPYRDIDSYECTYMESSEWKAKSVIYPENGIYPQRVTLFGVTDEATALEMATYYYKQDKYRRRVVTFDTDIQGLVPQFLDKVLVSHSSLQWGNAGQVMSVSGNAISLSEPLADGSLPAVTFRNIDGSVSDTYPVDITDEYNVTIIGEIPAWVEVNTFYTVGKAEEFLVTAVKPKGENVTIELVNYVEEVYQ